MEKFDSINGFHEFRSRLLKQFDPKVPTLVISAGTCGQASGANAVIRAAKRELLRKGPACGVRLRITGCHGFCAMEPSV
ncbi:MAG TPA: (2Fe-2S) ferredoxin domain-containing protein, partial [Deltaproteobacteria bacterium]|nr:(2Fe-2S) ferredoxin domain-containing protein [Deltaproteobacteria bacterium]